MNDAANGVNLATGANAATPAASSAFDPIWIYREGATVNQASVTDITSVTSAYSTLYGNLGTALNDWMLAEARYWAYEASYSTHIALVSTA